MNKIGVDLILNSPNPTTADKIVVEVGKTKRKIYLVIFVF